jgi:hypothetical protein
LKNVIASSLLCLLAVPSLATAEDWTEKVKVGGDLRYRHEILDTENSDARTRERIRARLNIIGNVSDQTKIEFSLSSGSSDPVSNNQTLTGAASSKAVVLDLAYGAYSPASLSGLTIVAGKTKNPFFKPGSSELLWDSDLRPEGASASYTRDFEGATLELVGAGHWVDERSSGPNSYMAAGQATITFHVPEKKSHVAVGGGYFHYGNLKGFAPLYEDDPFGNTVDTAGNFLYEYRLLEGYAEVGLTAGEKPVTFYGDFVVNTNPDSANTAWLVGVRLGKAKKLWSWQMHFNYRRVERDAVFGLFTDSDFRNGGTNGKGSEFGAALQVTNDIQLAGTYFYNWQGLEDGTVFQRLQLDAKLKF